MQTYNALYVCAVIYYWKFSFSLLFNLYLVFSILFMLEAYFILGYVDVAILLLKN